MRCKEAEEGKTPPRSCYICRREDCPVWQDLAGKKELSVPIGKDRNGEKIEVSLEELAEDEGYEPEEKKGPEPLLDGEL